MEVQTMRPIDADYVKTKLNKSALGGHLHYYVCGVIDDAPTIDTNATVTEETIAAVFSWFADHMPKILELDERAEYSITYFSSEYELVMRRKEQNGGAENDKF
jgi:hypothetical protein